MACRITELVLDCRDADALSRWWCRVLDWVELERDEDAVEIGPRAPGTTPTLVFSRSDDPRRGKLPLHLDVNPCGTDQDAELERLLGLGAVRADVGQTGEESWYVLADPEGNEFCLLRRQVEPG